MFSWGQKLEQRKSWGHLDELNSHIRKSPPLPQTPEISSPSTFASRLLEVICYPQALAKPQGKSEQPASVFVFLLLALNNCVTWESSSIFLALTLHFLPFWSLSVFIF